MIKKRNGTKKPSEVKVIRDKLGLSQTQFSVLLNIPVATIQGYEQKVRGVKSGGSGALKTLLGLLVGTSKDTVFAQLLADASGCKYSDIKEAKAALSMIRNSDIPDLAKSALEMSVLVSNKHFKLSELGFVSTEIPVLRVKK